MFLLTLDKVLLPDAGETSSKLRTLLNPTTPEDYQLVDTKCAVNELDKEVRLEYAKFIRRLGKLFEEMSISTDDILLSFSCLEDDDSSISSDIRNCTSIKSFMQVLRKTQSWYSFSTAASLACMHGESEGKELVEEYEKKLKVHLLKRIELPVANKAERIVVKFNDKREKFTEKKIIEFRCTVSKVLNLDMKEFVLRTVEKGCVQLTFLFPLHAAPYVKQAMNSISDKLEEWKVLSVTVKG